MQGIIDTQDTRSMMDFILKYKVPVDVYNELADKGIEASRFVVEDKLWNTLNNMVKIRNQKKLPEGYKRGGHIKSLEHDRMKFELMMRGKHG